MSQKEKVFTRKQLLVIFKIAFLEAMALSLIIPTISSTGETSTLSVCPSSPSSPCETQVQSGVQPCFTGGGATCTTTVTFSPAYSVTPQLSWSVRWPNLPSAAASSIGTATFLSVEQTGATWINMPAAPTEIFGDTLAQHQLYLRTVGVNSALFFVSCPTASITLGAYLVPQFSTDAGVTWKFLDTGTTTDGNTYHILIDGSANANSGACGTSALIPASSSTVNTFNAAAIGNIALRVIGVGGGGVGDSPVFTEIGLQFFNLIPNVCYASDSGLSATSITFTISCTRGQSLTEQFRWKTYILA